MINISRKRFSYGFTLIEMLIVVTIIALLSSIILVGLGSSRAKARDARRIADLHNTMVALELYYSKYQFYPRASNWEELSDILTDPYIGIGVSKIPRDPLSNSGYSYEYGTSGQDYVLGSVFETKDPALDDDIDRNNIYGVNCGTEIEDTIYCVKP